MEKTAIEWLTNELKSLGIYSSTLKEKCESAKEMEKQNIIITYIDGYDSDCMSHESTIVYANDYYNKKFKQG